eukprot:826553-Alexandrium_andersonii.AAC.1
MRAIERASPMKSSLCPRTPWARNMRFRDHRAARASSSGTLALRCQRMAAAQRQCPSKNSTGTSGKSVG